MTYRESVDGITVEHLQGGFFDGWPNPPSPDSHLRILQGSTHVVLAVESDGQVVGFITAISDRVSCAYIPHLEVLPAYRGSGIGKELTRGMLTLLKDIYMIDLCCDEDVTPFYTNFGFSRVNGMVIRNRHRQACD